MGGGASEIQSAILEHLAEQREALAGLDEALLEGASDELLEMRAQIQEAVHELERLVNAEDAADTPCMQALEGFATGAAPAANVGHRNGGEAEQGSGPSSGSDLDEGELEDTVPSRAAIAMAADAEAVARAADAGPQTETVNFAGWEQHTRGVASKLMAAMGYRDGTGLGAAKQGSVAPLKTWVLQRGAGLGHAAPPAAGAQPDGQPKKARRGGGAKTRAAQAAKAAKEAARDAQNQLEIAAGAPGLFAFINTRLGSTGAAQPAAPDHPQQQRGAPSGRPAPGEQGAGGSRYFAAQGAGSAAASKRPKQAPAPPDRRALALQQDAIVALREKLQRLREMSARNARDRVVSAQVRRQVEATEKELAAAEAASSHVHRAVHASEKRRSWLSF